LSRFRRADDGRLVILDLEHPEGLQVLPQVGAIGSICWPRVNQGVCPSLTLDDGTFLLHDLRVRPAAPAFRATLGRKELFAPVRYTDNHVLLGFGDGELQHLDVRVEDRILDRVSDPFVQAIGSLDYDHATRSLLVSGIPDMLLWSHDWATGALQSACHAIEGGATTNAVSAVSGAFTDAGRVVLVTTDGSLSILKPIRPGTSHLAGGDDESVPKRRRKLLPPLASVPEPREAASPGRRRR